MAEVIQGNAAHCITSLPRFCGISREDVLGILHLNKSTIALMSADSFFYVVF